MSSFVLALLLSLQSAEPAQSADAAQGRGTAPVDRQAVRVVELFTSQGCPMCPDANAMLGELIAQDEGVIALAYGVNYWDVYGWSDTFASQRFVERQEAYVHTGQAHRVYTPHFVVNGGPEKVRFSRERVSAAVRQASPLPDLIETGVEDGMVTVRIDGPAREHAAQIWAVTYHPGRETQLIEDGPNAGREMVHYNMARTIERLGSWPGGPLEVAFPAPDSGLAAAILVQDGRGGRILSAAHAP